jgi:hypothetical protein
MHRVASWRGASMLCRERQIARASPRLYVPNHGSFPAATRQSRRIRQFHCTERTGRGCDECDGYNAQELFSFKWRHDYSNAVIAKGYEHMQVIPSHTGVEELNLDLDHFIRKMPSKLPLFGPDLKRLTVTLQYCEQ